MLCNLYSRPYRVYDQKKALCSQRHYLYVHPRESNQSRRVCSWSNRTSRFQNRNQSEVNTIDVKPPKVNVTIATIWPQLDFHIDCVRHETLHPIVVLTPFGLSQSASQQYFEIDFAQDAIAVATLLITPNWGRHWASLSRDWGFAAATDIWTWFPRV